MKLGLLNLVLDNSVAIDLNVLFLQDNTLLKARCLVMLDYKRCNIFKSDFYGFFS